EGTGEHAASIYPTCDPAHRFRAVVRPARVRGGPGGLKYARSAPSGVHARVQTADVRQVAVALGEIQSVAHDELVGDVETDLQDVQIRLHGIGFAQQGDDLDRARVPRAEVAHEPRQGQARIDDVLDDDHV